MDDQIVFGSRMILVTLPDRTRFVPQGLSTALIPVENLETALRDAFRSPLDRPPLRDTARPGCSVIQATPCPDRWDGLHHPSYREVWDRVLARTRDPYEIRDLFEEDFAHRPECIHKYRFGYGFHPLHGIMATYPLAGSRQ